MRLFALGFLSLHCGCFDRDVKLTSTTWSPVSTTSPSLTAITPQWSHPVFEPFEDEPDDPLISSLHTGMEDVSESLYLHWYFHLVRILQLAHRGDWMTWIGFGGPGMVEYVGDIATYDALKGLFVLAGELGSRPVPEDALNLTQALGSVCGEMKNFAIEALAEARIRQNDVASISLNNVYRSMLEKTPFANLHVPCLLPDDIRIFDMILNHRIGRRLIQLSADNSHFTPDRYETSTTASLSDDLVFLSFAQVANIALGFRVKYADDEAIGDGVFRDWVVKVGQKILSSDMFVMSDDGKYKTILDSDYDLTNLWKFKAVGRFFALSLIEGISLGVEFNFSLYAILLGKSTAWTMDDLLAEDERFHESLQAISLCKIDENCADFMLEFETKDGRNLRDPSLPVVSEPVTEANVDQYVALTLAYEVYGARDRIYRAINSGFREILPRNIFANFITPSQVGRILKGSTDVDIALLRNNIDYSGFYPHDGVIEWFWKFIEEGGTQRAMQLVHFITGMKSLPVGGIAKLATRIAIRKYPYHRQRLYPISHLCFGALDLPDYPTEMELRNRVAEAILQETLGMV